MTTPKANYSAYWVDTYSHRTKTTKSREPVFLDIETTGLNPYYHDIIEVGLIGLSGEVLMDYRLLPMFPARAEEAALAVNGYTQDAWMASDNLGVPADVYQEVFDKTKGKIIVGSNPSFDTSWLSYKIWQYLKTTPSWYYKPLCVGNMYYGLTGEFKGLESILTASAIETAAVTHSAVDDCQAARATYIHLMDLMAQAKALQEFATHSGVDFIDQLGQVAAGMLEVTKAPVSWEEYKKSVE